MRLPVAPNAARIASSRARTAPCASIRFATLLEAISSTNDADANRTSSASFALPVTSTLNGATLIPRPMFQSGSSCAKWPAIVPRSANAIAGVGRGRRRATRFHRI